MIERLFAEQEEMKENTDADREQMLARMNANMKTMQEKRTPIEKLTEKIYQY
jgi:hypothetical protein